MDDYTLYREVHKILEKVRERKKNETFFKRILSKLSNFFLDEQWYSCLYDDLNELLQQRATDLPLHIVFGHCKSQTAIAYFTLQLDFFNEKISEIFFQMPRFFENIYDITDFEIKMFAVTVIHEMTHYHQYSKIKNFKKQKKYSSKDMAKYLSSDKEIHAYATENVMLMIDSKINIKFLIQYLKNSNDEYYTYYTEKKISFKVFKKYLKHNYKIYHKYNHEII